MTTINNRADLHPYASAPLNHLAKSLENLDVPGGTIDLTWNSAMRMDMPEATKQFLSSGRPTLCMETPLFGRHLWQFDGSGDPERTYYRIATHDPSVLYGGFRIVGPDKPNLDRLEKMFSKLGHEIKPWREETSTGHILMALQVPGDTSLKGVDVFQAATWDIFELKRRTKRPIVASIHPDCLKEGWAMQRMGTSDSVNMFLSTCRQLGVRLLDPHEKTSDFHEGACCIVTQTSGASFEALLDGVPSVALHRGSFQYPISLHTLEYPEYPAYLHYSRRQWWSQLAYIQFSWAEIQRGEHLETVAEILANE